MLLNLTYVTSWLHWDPLSIDVRQDSSDLEREKTRTEITRALEEERTERLRMDEECLGRSWGSGDLSFPVEPRGWVP